MLVLGTRPVEPPEAPASHSSPGSWPADLLPVDSVPQHAPHFQSYLVKMPQAAIDLFPPLRAAVDQAEARSMAPAAPSPVAQTEEAIADAAGKMARRGRGQGFQLDQAAKVVV